MAGACGECVACCLVYAIPEYDNPSDEWCPHCDGDGCKVYDDRPKPCQTFACLWLETQRKHDPDERMPVEYRPDRSGVLIGPTSNKNVVSVTGEWRSDLMQPVFDRLAGEGYMLIMGESLSTPEMMRDGADELMVVAHFSGYAVAESNSRASPTGRACG